MKKILLTMAAFSMLNLSAHCMANESDLLYILPPQISYTTIVREFVADLEDHQQNHRFNNYKIQNGGELATIMRDYPLTNGYTQEPENLRLGISYAVFSEFRPSDDPELYTKNGQTIMFHYPFLFKDKLFTLKLALCDQPMNTVLRKEYTSEWRADGIDHLLEALGKSRYVGPFIGELIAKAEQEKNKLLEWAQG